MDGKKRCGCGGGSNAGVVQMGGSRLTYCGRCSYPPLNKVFADLFHAPPPSALPPFPALTTFSSWHRGTLDNCLPDSQCLVPSPIRYQLNPASTENSILALRRRLSAGCGFLAVVSFSFVLLGLAFIFLAASNGFADLCLKPCGRYGSGFGTQSYLDLCSIWRRLFLSRKCSWPQHVET